MSLTGERGGGPVKPGLPVADLTSGLWVAIAILAALAGRARTGKGCYVDFSMLDGQVALLTLAAARYFALGEVPPRLGTEHPGRVPSATFRCTRRQATRTSPRATSTGRRCARRSGSRTGARPVRHQSGRVERRDEVMRVLTEAIAKLDRDELLARLDAVGRPGRPGQRRRRDPRRPARARAAGSSAASTTRASANSRRSRCPTSSSAGTTRRSAGRRRSASTQRARSIEPSSQRMARI